MTRSRSVPSRVPKDRQYGRLDIWQACARKSLVRIAARCSRVLRVRHSRFFFCSLLAFAVLASGVSCTPAETCACGMPSSQAGANVHAWKVYEGDELVLDVFDKPGTISSTASLPPGVAPKQHSFLSANARSAAHESKLHALLEASTSLPDFLQRLEGAGFAVKPLQASP